MKHVINIFRVVLIILFSILGTLSLVVVLSKSLGYSDNSSLELQIVGIILSATCALVVVLLRNPSILARNIVAVHMCLVEIQYRWFNKVTDIHVAKIADKIFDQVGISGLYSWTVLRYKSYLRENKDNELK